MSSSYERMNYITSFGFSERWRKQFLNLLSSSNDTIEIIDLLTGMGETWSGIREKFPKAKLTAVDFSEGMLQYAKEKNTKEFNNEVVILQQDVLSNSLKNNTFDILTCAFGLKTFDSDQLNTLASEVLRVLKPGGYFSFIEISKPQNKILLFFYTFYLNMLIPVLGKLLLGDPREYKMLWKYTDKFGDSKQAAAIFDRAGLEVRFVSYFYGCATGIVGKKRNTDF